MKSRKRRYRFISLINDPTVKVGIALALFFAGLTMAILIVERASNPSLESVADAFWYTLVTITTIGYGDVTPVTEAGRLIAVLIMSSGVVVFGAVSGKLASVFFDRQQKRERGLIKLKKKREHLIVCGWKPDMDSLLAGILRANPETIPSDIVLVNGASQERMYPILSSSALRGINYVNGDFIEEETLERANVKGASNVMVLADCSRDYSEMEMDSRTVLAVITIKKMNRTSYVAAEILDGKFRKHLENERCDEIILSKQYEKKVLISASGGTGTSHVLERLFGDSESEGLAIVDIPDHAIGKSFGELSRIFDGLGEGILVGLLENTGNFYLRKQEALSEAQKNPDISGIVSNLKKVKELKSNRTVLAPPKDYAVKKYSKAILVCPTADRDGENA